METEERMDSEEEEEEESVSMVIIISGPTTTSSDAWKRPPAGLAGPSVRLGVG